MMQDITDEQRALIAIWAAEAVTHLVSRYNDDLKINRTNRKRGYHYTLVIDPSDATATPPTPNETPRRRYFLMEIANYQYNLVPPDQPPQSTTVLFTDRGARFVKRFNEFPDSIDPPRIHRRSSNASSQPTSLDLGAFLLTSLAGIPPDQWGRTAGGRAKIPFIKGEDGPLPRLGRAYIAFTYIELESESRFSLTSWVGIIDWDLSRRLAVRAQHRMLQVAKRRYRQMAQSRGNETGRTTADDVMQPEMEHAAEVSCDNATQSTGWGRNAIRCGRVSAN